MDVTILRTLLCFLRVDRASALPCGPIADAFPGTVATGMGLPRFYTFPLWRLCWRSCSLQSGKPCHTSCFRMAGGRVVPSGGADPRARGSYTISERDQIVLDWIGGPD